MANASEVQWSNIPQTNFGDALQMFRAGADYYTKAASGLKDTFDTAAQAVRNQNQALAQQYIDQQSMGDLLNNKQAINDHIADMMSAGGNVYDPTVLNQYLNARPDALAKQQETANALTLDNIKTGNSVANDTNIKAAKAINSGMPFAQIADYVKQLAPNGITPDNQFDINQASNKAAADTFNSVAGKYTAQNASNAAQTLAPTEQLKYLSNQFVKEPDGTINPNRPENQKVYQQMAKVTPNDPILRAMTGNKVGEFQQQQQKTELDRVSQIIKNRGIEAATTGQGIDNDIKRQTGLPEAQAKIAVLNAQANSAKVNDGLTQASTDEKYVNMGKGNGKDVVDNYRKLAPKYELPSELLGEDNKINPSVAETNLTNLMTELDVKSQYGIDDKGNAVSPQDYMAKTLKEMESTKGGYLNDWDKSKPVPFIARLSSLRDFLGDSNNGYTDAQKASVLKGIQSGELHFGDLFGEGGKNINNKSIDIAAKNYLEKKKNDPNKASSGQRQLAILNHLKNLQAAGVDPMDYLIAAKVTPQSDIYKDLPSSYQSAISRYSDNSTLGKAAKAVSRKAPIANTNNPFDTAAKKVGVVGTW